MTGDRSWLRSRWPPSTRACPGRVIACARPWRQIDDHASRVDLLTRLATWYVLDANDDELSALLAREVAADHGPDTRLALEVAALEMLIMIPDRHAERAARLAAAHGR